MDDIEYSEWAGAQSTCNAILQNWTDDNNLNRQMVEMLLSQAIIKAAEVEFTA